MNKALVVLSGGQDSTTCLYWAINKFGCENTRCISFDYGQRHIIELKSAKKIAELAKVEHAILPINTFSDIGGNSLTDKMAINNEINKKTQLPNTFVPGRNLIFLTFAAAFAYTKKIQHLVTGVAQTDYSGYPDCRENTLKSLEKTISLGMEFDIKIHTPLMKLSKAATVKLAIQLGAMEALAYSHSCYNGQQPPCNHCSACILRAKGFSQANTPDPLIVRLKENI